MHTTSSSWRAVLLSAGHPRVEIEREERGRESKRTVKGHTLGAIAHASIGCHLLIVALKSKHSNERERAQEFFCAALSLAAFLSLPFIETEVQIVSEQRAPLPIMPSHDPSFVLNQLRLKQQERN
jgi:hypothetical protein